MDGCFSLYCEKKIMSKVLFSDSLSCPTVQKSKDTRYSVIYVNSILWEIVESELSKRQKLLYAERKKKIFEAKKNSLYYYHKHNVLEKNINVFSSAQIEHNKALNVPTWEHVAFLTATDCTLEMMLMEGLANAPASAISCPKSSSSAHRKPLADAQS